MNNHHNQINNCRIVACRCGSESLCKCNNHKFTKNLYHTSYSDSIMADYWLVNPCRPWISSLFGSPHDIHGFTTSNSNVDRSERSGLYQNIIAHSNEICDRTVGLHSEEPFNGSSKKHHGFPTQTRMNQHECIKIEVNPVQSPQHIIVGPPCLKIYKFQLPIHLLHLLDYIVEGCQNHAATLPNGWMTYLYSLTKQDIALRDIPGLYESSRPIVAFIKKTIERVYNVNTIRIDRNQPHVLKYSVEDGSNHTGVELHHDKCDLTANLMLSRSNSYSGGGTFFPDANTTVKLEFGEFIIHPGNLVHAGVDITHGTRYLMVLFTHT